MKKVRSFISVLCVIALLAVCIPVMTFSAAASETMPNTKVHYFDSSDVVYNTAEITLAPVSTGGFSLSIAAGGTVGSTYKMAYLTVPYSVWSELPYLHVDIDSVGTSAYFNLWVKWENGEYFADKHSSSKPADYVGSNVIDTSAYINTKQNTNIVIELYVITGSNGQSINFKNVYASSSTDSLTKWSNVDLYTEALTTAGTITITPGAGNSFTAVSNGLAYFTFEVDAATRALYRYMYLDLTGTAYLHVWVQWKSNSAWTNPTVYNTASPSTYTGHTVVDLSAYNEPVANDTLVFVCYVMGPQTGSGIPTTCGNSLTADISFSTVNDATIRLLPNLSATPNSSTDGGYYTTGAGFSAANHGSYGVELYNNNTDYTAVTWALPVSQIAVTPYLVLEIDQASTTLGYMHLIINDLGGEQKWVYNWTPVSSVNGKVVMNLYDVLETQTPNQWVYFSFYLLESGPKTLALNSWYLSGNPNGVLPGTTVAPTICPVHFETNGGSDVFTQLVPFGGTVDEVDPPVRNGYLFAGWYTDPACTSAFIEGSSISGEMTLYAGWNIQEGITSAFAQVQKGTNLNSESSSIRFVAAVSSLHFDEVGFVFSLSNNNPTVNGTNCTQLSTTTVYDSITADGFSIFASQLGGKYLIACTVNHIPNQHFNTPIYVTTYAKKPDGTYLYAPTKNHCVSNWFSANVKDNGAWGDGVANDAQAFLDTFAAVGNAGTVIIPAGTYLIDTNITVPADITLVFETGARLHIASGKTVTINGYIDAGITQIFEGTGTIAGNIRGTGYAQWFGTFVGDNNTAYITANTATLQKAVNVLSHLILPAFSSNANGNVSPGYYHISTIQFNKPIVFESAGAYRAGISYLYSGMASGGAMFSINSSNVTIKNLEIWGDSSNAAIRVNTTSQNLSYINIENLYLRYTGKGICDTQGAYTVTNSSISKILVENHYGIGVHLTDFTANNTLSEVTAQYAWNSSSGIVIENTTNMMANELDVLMGHSSSAHASKNNKGIEFKNCAGITLNRAMVDSVGNTPVTMVNCTGLNIKNLVVSIYDGIAVMLDNVDNSTFNMIKITSISSATSSAGLYMRLCDGVNLTNLGIFLNQSGGLTLDTSTGNRIVNLQMSNNAFGVRETSTASYGNTLVAASIRNSGNAVSFVGVNSHYAGII